MKRILVVDDDRQMVRTLCDILDLHGWETHARHRGEEAVTAVAERDFTAVLMDVKMEGIDGVEALARIRGQRPDARVVLMTAYSSVELLDQAEREGAMEILTKPVQLPALIDLLGAVLTDGKPVLVVDDDPAFLRSLAGPLRVRGFEVLQASGRDQGLSLLNAGQPVAAMLDLRLGEMGEEDVVLAIKRASPTVAAILCSGDSHVIDEAGAESPTGSIYGAVRKPFSPDHLIGMLDELVRAS